MKHFIGIDIGTSSTKAVLYNQNGTTVFTSSINYDIARAHPLWAEQEPEMFWEATLKILKAIVAESKVNPKNIVSLGLTGQMHGLVILDKNDEVIRPAIIWCDNRTEKEHKQIEINLGRKYILDTTSNVPMSSFTLAKLLWLKTHEPAAYAQINKILLPKDYVQYRLTNNFYSDYSDISGTQLFNLTTKHYDQKILDFLDLDKSKLPQVHAAVTPSGYISQSVAALTGLHPNTLVIVGSGDQTASAFGNGIFGVGEMSINLGSSGVLFVPAPMVKDEVGAVQTFAYYDENSYHVMGVTQGCGISFKWLKDNFYTEVDAYKVMEEEINDISLDANNVVFLPYLQGERTPILDPNARGLIFNLTSDSNRGAIARSVFEGVAFSLYHSYEAIMKLNIQATTIKVTGGVARNKTFTQMLADIFGREIIVQHHEETGCLGAAMMAAIGVDMYKTPAEAFKAMGVHDSFIVKPNLDRQSIYAKRYALYQNLYKAVKPLYT